MFIRYKKMLYRSPETKKVIVAESLRVNFPLTINKSILMISEHEIEPFFSAI